MRTQKCRTYYGHGIDKCGMNKMRTLLYLKMFLK